MRRSSHDDLAAVQALDAAESRARASLLLAEAAEDRVNELEHALARVRDDNEHVETANRLSIADTVALLSMAKGGAPVASEKPISVSPTALTFRGHHWKIAIPLSVLVALVPLTWALVNDYRQMKSDFEQQTKTYASMQKRSDDLEQRLNEVVKSNNDLRETVARLAGYVTAALPNAGVKVPGAEPGAIAMSVQADPLPRGARRQTPVTTHTLVPAPKPQ